MSQLTNLIDKLSAKHKLGLSFALYVLVFLLLFTAFFFVVFKSALIYQVKREMATGINEILTEQVTFKNDVMSFAKDPDGDDMSEELLRTGFSGLFLAKDLSLIQGFGVFSLYSSQDKQSISELLALSKKAVESKQVQQVSLVWQQQKIFVFFVPLVSNGTVLGVAILGKSFSEVDTIMQVMALMVGVFGLFVVIASFILGYLLSAKSFSPIQHFVKVIDEVDLDKLDKTISIKGHTDDELVILASKINKMLARIKDMSQQQKEFVSNVSHELRTPLTRAVSSLEVITPTDADYDSEINEVKEDLMAISNLLEKLLYLSKLRKNDIDHGDKANLKDVFADLAHELAPELAKKHSKLVTDIASDVDVHIPYEYARVLFSNLLLNAVNYSKENATIRVTAEKAATTFKVRVIDEGVGMTQLELAKVFERFYRGDEGRTMSYGSGIGLSIVKRLCDLYDIVLNISSTKGRGSTVELEFKV